MDEIVSHEHFELFYFLVFLTQVHEAETAAQMRFDRFCDEKRARLWPAVPIRLSS